MNPITLSLQAGSALTSALTSAMLLHLSRLRNAQRMPTLAHARRTLIPHRLPGRWFAVNPVINGSYDTAVGCPTGHITGLVSETIYRATIA
jgi:hypothetical protein